MKNSILKVFLIGLPVFLLMVRPTRADETNAEPNVMVTPMGQYVTVRGDEAKFRQDWGIKEGWMGGIDDATYHQKLGKDWQMDLEGRAIFDNEDYKVRLEIAKPDIGFLHAGFTEFRTYSDDFGGFFRPFTPPSFELHRDLFIRNGDIFVEAGLTLPGLPKLTLGYERQFRNGEKSLLEWGGATQGGTTRNIFPSFKAVDETVDIVKLQVEHDIRIVHLADQFRYEHYRDNTTTMDGSVNLDTGSTKTVTVHENYSHDAFYNAFHMDSHVNDKVYWSLGYLYTTLEGDAGLSLDTVPFNAPTDKNWMTQAVEVEMDSHVVNLNAMFGPFAGLILYTGLQAEQTESRGFTDAVLTQIGSGGATNNPLAFLHGNDNKRSLEETAGARYTKIPWTTLYAEGKWTEQDIDLDQEADAGSPTFQRVTDTAILRQDYIVGFNTAPVPRLTLAGRYRHSIYQNDYDQELDTIEGYPGFITGQDFTTDEIMAKLTLRPCSRFSLSFKYQLLATDISTTTATVPSIGLTGPRRSLLSGNFDSSIYSISATVTPISRLYLTGLFSFQDTRTATFADGNPAVLNYEGNVYTVLGAAGYALDNKTDLNVQYTYSRADNLVDNFADGLPLGVANQRTGVLVGLTRRLTSNMIARLRYGFYDFNDRTNGGLDNYTAHLASASCIVRF